MKILNYRWKNVGLYGNKITEVKFDNSEYGLHLLYGKNGTGKSTFLNIPSFVFYGKIGSKKQKDIANRVNKTAWAQIEFLSDKNDKITVTRQLFPTLFKVDIDDGVNAFTDDRRLKGNTQDELEENVLKMSHHVFNNIVSVNLLNFQSFISMKAEDKRKIIDRFFSLSLINDMKESVSKKHIQITEKINNLKGELNQINNNIISLEDKILKVKQEIEKNKNSEITLLLETNNEKLKELESVKSELLSLKEKIYVLDIEKSKLDKQNNDISFSLRSLKKDIELYTNDVCPTCKTPLTTDYHKSLQKEYNDKYLELNTNLSEISLKIDEILKEKKHNSTLYDNINENAQKIKNIISVNENSIKKINEQQNNDITLNNFVSLIEKNEDQKKEKNNKLDEFYYYDKLSTILKYIYSDEGIKKLAFEKITPLLNAKIQNIMEEIEPSFVTKILFDNSFECTLKYKSDEISVESLSAGQQRIINVIVLLALVQIMKMKYPYLNILFLDEVFSSLDAENIEKFINILKNWSEEYKLHIIVVHHALLNKHHFKNIYETKVENNFSRLYKNNSIC